MHRLLCIVHPLASNNILFLSLCFSFLIPVVSVLRFFLIKRLLVLISPVFLLLEYFKVIVSCLIRS